MKDLMKDAALELAIRTPAESRPELAGFCFHFRVLILKNNYGMCLAVLENFNRRWLTPLKDLLKKRYKVQDLREAGVTFSGMAGKAEGLEICRILAIIETTLGDSDNAHRTDFKFKF